MDDTTTSLVLGIMGILGVFLLIVLVLAALVIIAMWKIFTKAGKPGWSAIVPYYNSYILGKIANSDDKITIALVAVTVADTLISKAITSNSSSLIIATAGLLSLSILVLWIITMVHLAAAFGEGVGFAVGIILLPFIFLPILAFGDYSYQCPQPRTPYGATPSDPFDSMK